MQALFDGITITDFHDDLHRNIVSLRESENLFDDLTDSPEGWQSAIALEVKTKPHTHVSQRPVIDRPFEEAVYNEAIDYPFENWLNTRYSNGSFGVWYGTDSLETSIHETVHHWRHGLLHDAGWQNLEGVSIERKVYNVRCDAALFNFLPKLDAFPALIDPTEYDFTHQVGARIYHDGHPGLVSRSARCDGDVYAIFNSQVLSNPRQMCFLTYRITSGSVIVERQPGKILFQIGAGMSARYY
ncbi:MAG: RES family NAD+ phosphorylase [Gammaproteobacteria bacterium]|nr:RES family NAD+ phosphorylase [Gammaproteobacteria bacterium]MCF6260408.1 RES family NAD+ phosphorylase [Gammaproteobacteria bacterium]